MKKCCFFWKCSSNMIWWWDRWYFIYFWYLNMISILVACNNRYTFIRFYKLFWFNNFCCICFRIFIWFPSRIYIVCYCWRFGNVFRCRITNIFCFSDIWTFFLCKNRLVRFVGRFFWNRLFCSNICRSTSFALFWYMMFSWW